MNKQNFKGDIGQVAGRDVKTVSESGDSLVNSNVVNIQVGQQSSEPVITDWQRKTIAKKVEAVMAITRLERLEVYRELMEEYELDEIRALPKSKYKTVLAKLDRWLTSAKIHAAELAKAAERPRSGKQEQQTPQTTRAVPCIHCETARTKLASTRLGLLAFALLALAATATAGYLLVKSPDTQQVDTPNAISKDVCHYAGQPYSLGSMITTDKQKLTCVSTDESPTWKEYSTSSPAKKSPRLKRPEKRVLSAEQPEVTPSSEASPIAASQ